MKLFLFKQNKQIANKYEEKEERKDTNVGKSRLERTNDEDWRGQILWYKSKRA